MLSSFPKYHRNTKKKRKHLKRGDALEMRKMVMTTSMNGPERSNSLLPNLQVPLILRRLVRPSEVLLAVAAVAKGLRAAVRPGAVISASTEVNGVDVVRQVKLPDLPFAQRTGQVVVGAGRLVGGRGVKAVDGGGHLRRGAELGVQVRGSRSRRSTAAPTSPSLSPRSWW